MANRSFKVGIIGASGAVGREVLRTLEMRKFPVRELVLFTSARSAGKVVQFNGRDHSFVAIKDSQDFSGFDFIFFTSGSSVSEKFAFKAAAQGAWVVDNASIFRMREDVPLVVPEINGHTLVQAKQTRVVANPNCTTAQMVMALKPLHDYSKIKRVVLASYQAVSGKGQKGIDEFRAQVQDRAAGRDVKCEAFPHPIAFNCLPHIDVFGDDGFTGEEKKVMMETRKIMGDQSIRVIATCVRVPVENCHSESVTVEFEKEITVAKAQELLKKMPGVVLADDPKNNVYPLATIVNGKDEVYVGRIRKDPSLEEGRHGLSFWVVGDNLRKGAALNAVQIAESIVQQNLCS